MKSRIFSSVVLLMLSACTSHKVYIVHYPEISQQPIAQAESVHIAPPPYIQEKQFIVIDPGHGGKDGGTQSLAKPTYSEKILNLATAKFLENYLRQMGYRTSLTRNIDEFVSLDNRVHAANSRSSDLFVSVHYNSASSKEAEGIEVFYYKTDKNIERMEASKKLADSVLKQMIKTTGAKSRGVKHGNLAVIRKTEMPAILIEGGFLTNDKELAKIKDPTYMKSMAWSIAQGIDTYFKSVISK